VTEKPPEEPPPLLGSWANIYAVELGALVVMIVVAWLLTWAYA
jgi:hypothetical protein